MASAGFPSERVSITPYMGCSVIPDSIRNPVFSGISGCMPEPVPAKAGTAMTQMSRLSTPACAGRTEPGAFIPAEAAPCSKAEIHGASSGNARPTYASLLRISRALHLTLSRTPRKTGPFFDNLLRGNDGSIGSSIPACEEAGTRRTTPAKPLGCRNPRAGRMHNQRDGEDRPFQPCRKVEKPGVTPLVRSAAPDRDFP